MYVYYLKSCLILGGENWHQPRPLICTGKQRTWETLWACSNGCRVGSRTQVWLWTQCTSHDTPICGDGTPLKWNRCTSILFEQATRAGSQLSTSQVSPPWVRAALPSGAVARWRAPGRDLQDNLGVKCHYCQKMINSANDMGSTSVPIEDGNHQERGHIYLSLLLPSEALTKLLASSDSWLLSLSDPIVDIWMKTSI